MKCAKNANIAIDDFGALRPKIATIMHDVLGDLDDLEIG